MKIQISFYVLKKSNLKKSDQFCVLKKQKKKIFDI